MQREDYLPVQNSNEQKGWTNNVLIHQEKRKIELFLPCYLRTKLKNIVSMDSSNGIGMINIVIILSIYYDRIDDIFPGILQTLQNNIVLRFKIDPPTRLEGGFLQYKDKDGKERTSYITKKVDEKQRLITFSIRRMMVVPLISHIFWSPFEYIKYVSTIAIDNVYFNQVQKKIKIQFNMMDLNKQFDKFSVVSYTDEGALGEFDLASSKIEAQFTNKRFYSGDLQQQLKNKIKKKLHLNQSHHHHQDEDNAISVHKIESFKFAHSIYPVFRRPLVPLFNLLFPVVILGLINLGIFFQNNLLTGKKIINIAALLISYLYFLPIMRQRIPPSNILVVSQIALFSMASLTLFTFVHTIQVRNAYEYEFQWKNEILFQIALILTLLIIAVLSIVALVFAFVFLPTYNVNRKIKEEKLQRKNWSNPQCDEYFHVLKELNFDLVQISDYSPKNNRKSTKTKNR